MTVLILSLNYAPEPTGIAPYASSLAKGLQSRGYNVRVLTTHPHYPEWKIHPGFGGWKLDCFVEGVPVTRLRHYVPAKPEGARRLLSELTFGFRLLVARWGTPDVIVLVSPALFSTALAMIRARISRGKPAVSVWLQDIYSLGITETGAAGGGVARVVTWVEKKTMQAASGVVVIHPRFAAYLSEKLGVDSGKIEVVRNWTHLPAPPATNVEATRDKYGWGADETVVLHAGNMGVKQGLRNVVNAARSADQQQLPIRFVLLGNGSQKEDLYRLAEGISRIQFIDSLDNEGFQAILVAADILLVNELRSVSEMAVPSKLTSYFNAGRPVLAATDISGVTAGEIMAAGGGVVVEAEDPVALLVAVLHLRNNPQQAAELGSNGMAYRREVLGEQGAIDRYGQWLRNLTNKRARERDSTLLTNQEGIE